MIAASAGAPSCVALAAAISEVARGRAKPRGGAAVLAAGPAPEEPSGARRMHALGQGVRRGAPRSAGASAVAAAVAAGSGSDDGGVEDVRDRWRRCATGERYNNNGRDGRVARGRDTAPPALGRQRAAAATEEAFAANRPGNSDHSSTRGGRSPSSARRRSASAPPPAQPRLAAGDDGHGEADGDAARSPGHRPPPPLLRAHANAGFHSTAASAIAVRGSALRRLERSGAECAVCMQSFEAVAGEPPAATAVRRLECCSGFLHVACVAEWVDEANQQGRAPTCPLCRCLL